MAIKVPVYQQRQQLGALPGVRTQFRDAEGQAFAKLGEAVGGAIQTGAKLGTQIIDKNDRAVLRDMMVKAKRKAQERQQAFSQLKGVNAIEASAKEMEHFNKDLDDLTEGVSDNQRNAFNIEREKLALIHNGQVSRHTAQQATAHRREAFAADKDLDDQNARMYGAQGNDKLLASGLADRKEAIRQMAEDEGWDKRITEQRLKQDTTSFHSSAIAGILENEDNPARARMARDYLGTHRKEIDPTTANKLQEIIEGTTLKGKARDIADKLFGSHKVGEWGFDTRSARDALINDPAVQKSPELRELAEGMLDATVRRFEADRRANDAPHMAQVELEIFRDRKRPRKGNPAYDQLSKDGKANAIRMWRAESQKGSDRRHRRDREALYDFQARATRDPKWAEGLDISQEYPYATREGRARIDKTRASMVSKAGFNGAELGRIIDGWISEGPKLKTKDQKKFKQRMLAELIEFKEKNNKEPSTEDAAAIYAKARRVLRRDDLIFDDDWEAWKFGPEDELVVPRKDAKQIYEVYMKRHNRAPTEDEVQQAYRSLVLP